MIFDEEPDTVIKKEKRAIPEINDDDSDSSVEIVHEDLRSKPSAMVRGGKNLNSAKPSVSFAKSNVMVKNDHLKPNR